MNKTAKIFLIAAGLLGTAAMANASPGGATGAASFARSYARVKRWEGGYQDDPNDPGNFDNQGRNIGTNMGITPATFRQATGRWPSRAEMKALTPEQAAEIFRKLFWDKIWGDKFKDAALADIVLDGVVNHGRGVRLFQEVLGDVATDNAWGPETHASMLAKNPAQLYRAYRERRRKYYHQLADNDPKLATFLKGWLRRIDSFQDY